MKLKISAATLTIGDVITAEEGFPNNRAIIDFLARFVVDGAGERVPLDEAKKQLYALPISELPDLARQMQEAITGMQASAVPLATSAS